MARPDDDRQAYTATLGELATTSPELIGVIRNIHEEKVSQLEQRYRMPDTTFGHETMGKMHRYLPHLLSPSNEKWILNFEGDPGSGKSTSMKEALDHVQGITPGESKVANIIAGRHRYFLTEVSWEREGEEKAIRAGKIKTPKSKPMTLPELMAADAQLRLRFRKAIDTSKITAAEVPVWQAYCLDGEWIGRPYGSASVWDLEQQANDFAGLPPHIVLHFITNASASLELFSITRRKNVKHPDLEHARRAMAAFGEPVPPSYQALTKVRNASASYEQMMFMEDADRAMRAQLKARGIAIAVPEDIVHSIYEAELQDDVHELGLDTKYGEDLFINMTRNNLEKGKLIEHILRDRLLVDPLRVANIYNNPTLADLLSKPGLDVGAIADMMRTLFDE